MIINIIGDETWSILNCTFFGVLHFLPFLGIFGHFLHFLGFWWGWGVLGVLLGYKITRGIKLVVRGSMIGFWKVWGGFEGVWACFGGSRWVKGGLLDPYRMFLPLWKSCKAPDLVPNTT